MPRSTRDTAPKKKHELLKPQPFSQMLQPDPGRRPDAAIVQRILCCLEAKLLLDHSLRLYQIIASHYEDSYFVIERERLRSWGFALGVFQPRGLWKWSACLVDLLTRPSLDALQSTFDELQCIKSGFSVRISVDSTAASFPGATVDELGECLPDDRNLHVYNDKLIALLAPDNKKTLDRFLFRSILRTDDPDGLRGIESEIKAQGTSGEIGILAQLKLIYQMAQQREFTG
jgi:hypothetical protein